MSSSSSCSLHKASSVALSEKAAAAASGSSNSNTNANNSSFVGRRKSSSSSQAQKLRGTFGRSLNEKLHFPFRSLGEVSTSSSSNSGSSSVGINVFRQPIVLDVFKEEDEDNEEVAMEIRNSSTGDPMHEKPQGGGMCSEIHSKSGDCGDVATTGATRIHKTYEVEHDDLSMGFLSDLPSGLIDVEGNIIGDVDLKFGQEFDDELSSVDEYQGYEYNENVSSSSSKRLKSGFRITDNNRDSRSTREPFLHRESTKNNQSSERTNAISPQYSEGSESSSNRQSRYFNNHSRVIVPQQKVLKRQIGGEVHRRRSRSPHAPLDRNHSSGATSNSSSTITQHYYPEGGWGFVVLLTATSCQTLLCGMQLSFGILMNPISHKFEENLNTPSGTLYAEIVGKDGLFIAIMQSRGS
jgi:hypothetical protein